MSASDFAFNRRRFLGRSGLGLGSIALAALLDREGPASDSIGPTVTDPLAVKAAHFPGTAKRVIYLFMMGGPSHLDLFDHKPNLRRFDGQPIPQSYVEGERFEQITQKQPTILASPYAFSRHGETGTELSELLPHTRRVVDELAFVRAARTDETVHPLAQLLLFTGLRTAGRPSLGSWVTYGLGTESSDLPGFVATVRGPVPQAHEGIIANGFLDSSHHGVPLRNRGAPILNLGRPPGVTREGDRRVVTAINRLNAERLAKTGDREIASRMRAYELAFRMQASAPNLIDLRDETQRTLDLYGADPEVPNFARDCLLARRMVERGVRFVQLSFGDWDHHANIFGSFPQMCREMDRPVTALIEDLKRRGLLEETLVIWGGEFGRTPVAQPQKTAPVGRDHHVHSFTMWFAGGGVRPGANVGSTDDLGFHPVEDSVHIHDLQATILHLLGLDHTRLTYRFQGRDFRLTDVHGDVVRGLLA
ncbi:MAG: sulfatase [Planctomycetaceae bacterium]|nr:sulfatase [Planctomycetaceae bacterium]